MDPTYEFSEDIKTAQTFDQKDELMRFKNEFFFPKTQSGEACLYFAGNSLGLQPKKTKFFVEQELSDWATLGVEGHFHAKNPWLTYHELLTAPTARLVGAKEHEVVVMNTLTVNLHLMMVSFYRPTPERYKIIIESGAFPSDQYAVASQAHFHGFDPRDAILELCPRPGETLLRTQDILNFIDQHGSKTALILLGNVNYLTGQAFDLKSITEFAHQKEICVGFDLAHGVGNLELNLHETQADFAIWCSYKYLNAGPGALAGCFVHERHAHTDRPRFQGWWGHDQKSRFKMESKFQAIPGAQGWQLSNPPILQLAALRASMEIFDQATMPKLRKKSESLTSYLEFLLKKLPCTIITPSHPLERGAQLSVRFKSSTVKNLIQTLAQEGVIVDFREPDVMRIAPAPLYTSFEDVYHLVKKIKKHVS